MSPGEALIGETVEMIAAGVPSKEMEAYERVWRCDGGNAICLPVRITWKRRGASWIRR